MNIGKSSYVTCFRFVLMFSSMSIKTQKTSTPEKCYNSVIEAQGAKTPWLFSSSLRFCVYYFAAFRENFITEQVLSMVGYLKNLRLATEVHYLFED